MKHTQGEWEAVIDHAPKKDYAKTTIYCNAKIVADCYLHPSLGIIGKAEAEANAKLIAASPELLKMCIATLEDLESGAIRDNEETYEYAIKNLQQAIIKATS